MSVAAKPQFDLRPSPHSEIGLNGRIRYWRDLFVPMRGCAYGAAAFVVVLSVVSLLLDSNAARTFLSVYVVALVGLVLICLVATFMRRSLESELRYHYLEVDKGRVRDSYYRKGRHYLVLEGLSRDGKTVTYDRPVDFQTIKRYKVGDHADFRYAD